MSQPKKEYPRFDINDPAQLDAAITEVFEGQDHRATGVLGGAIVENALEQCLRSAVTEKLLFKWLPKTFAERIKMCRAIGLIGPETHNNLMLIKDIRNKFAHTVLSIDAQQNPKLSRMTFDDQEIADLCGKINSITNWTKFTGENSIGVFCETCIVIACGLMQEIQNGKKPLLP